jgi:hypothetical protein
MFFHVPDQSSQTLAKMVARAFVVNVAENALNRVSLRAIARQPDPFKARMLLQPAIDRLRFMDAVIVTNDINFAIAFPEGLIEMVQQLAEQDVVFVRSQGVINPPCHWIKRRGQLVFLILARVRTSSCVPLSTHW